MTAFVGIATAAAQQYLSTLVVRPKRQIGGFTAHVTIREEHVDELEITTHPVQQGASIADHAFMLPARLIVECAWSDSPQNAGLLNGLVAGQTAAVTAIKSLASGNSASTVRDVYAKLLQLQRKREPFSVTTGKRKYDTMLVKSLAVKTDQKTENILSVTVTLQEIIIVSTRAVSIAGQGANPADATVTGASSDKGVKQLTPATSYTP